jgi:hypothetical protein
MNAVWIALFGYFMILQNTDKVVRIEFNSLTRGFQETVVITADSAVRAVNPRNGLPFTKAKAIKKRDWECLQKTINKISLSEISRLESPTMKRAYDGALHSTITITTKSGEQFTHSFDDDDPHEKLKPLMREILQWKKKLTP